MIEQKGLTLKFFVEKIGMTRQGFEPSIINDTVSAKVLLKMSEVLNVPVSHFFNESQSVSISKAIKSCQGCKDKEKIIKVLEENVRLLEDKVHYFGDMLEKAGIQSKRAS